MSNRGSYIPAMNEVIELTKDNLEHYMSSKWLLVVYTTKGCKSCVKIKPHLYRLEEKYKVVIVDFDDNPRSQRFFKRKLMMFPTMTLFEQGYLVKEIEMEDLIKMKK